MKRTQLSKQNNKILSDKEINENLLNTFMHKAKIVSGTSASIVGVFWDVGVIKAVTSNQIAVKINAKRVSVLVR